MSVSRFLGPLCVGLSMALSCVIASAHEHGSKTEAKDALAIPAADTTVVTPPEEMTEAIRAVFPESYSQFMTVSYERQDAGTERDPEIWPKAASFLVPVTAYDGGIATELDSRVAALIDRVLRPDDAHCEDVSVGEPEEYGWMAWPDKNVRKITVTFNVAC
ncbi:MAG: hypothetical protein AAFY01_06105 [Pseudomonadota bacterium]